MQWQLTSILEKKRYVALVHSFVSKVNCLFLFGSLWQLLRVDYHFIQEISGDELVKALQIRNKIPRRKTLSALEEKVLSILTEKGYVAKDEGPGDSEVFLETTDEDEDEDEVVDGEVDEGDLHITPTRKHVQLVSSLVQVA